MKIFDPLDTPLHPQQLIEASAGTGKTWTICAIFMRLLFEYQYPLEKILAVSFTKAASTELKQRIHQQLLKVDAIANDSSQYPEESFLQALCQKFPAQLAQKTALALNAFDRINVCTIHSFCQNALKRTVFLTGLAFDWEIHAQDSPWFLQKIQDCWHQKILTCPQNPGEVIFQKWLSQHKISPDSVYQMLLPFLYQTHIQQSIPQTPSQDLSTLSSAAQQYYQQLQQLWNNENHHLVTLIQKAKLSQKSYKPSQIDAKQAQLSSLLSMDYPHWQPTQALEYFSSTKLAQAKTKQSLPLAHAFFELADTFLSIQVQLEQNCQIYYAQWLGNLLQQSQDQYTQTQQDHLSYDELLFTLHHALQNDSQKQLAQALQALFPAVLIDEFQDTNQIQYDIFKTIYTAPAKHPSILTFVGDPKQAIYTFRNADIFTYLDVRKNIPHTYSLTTNYRSNAELTQAINHVLAYNPNAFLYPDLPFSPVTPTPTQMHLYDPRDQTPGTTPLRLWQLPCSPNQKLLSKAEAQAWSVQTVADEIKTLLTNNTYLEQVLLQPNHIAVLVRSHRQADQIYQALHQIGIPAQKSQRQESIFKSKAAQDILAILCAANQPSQPQYLRSALLSPVIGYGPKQLLQLRQDPAQWEQVCQQWHHYHEIWKQHGLMSFLRSIAIPQDAPLLPDSPHFFQDFQQLSIQLQQQESQGASHLELITWLKNQQLMPSEDNNLSTPDCADAVQISTIHNAKGLEYPIVFCPFLWDNAGVNHRPTTPANPLVCWHHPISRQSYLDFGSKQQDEAQEAATYEAFSESIRLSYVALTRAKYRCYLVFGAYRSTKHLESHYGPINWLLLGKNWTEWLQASTLPSPDPELLLQHPSLSYTLPSAQSGSTHFSLPNDSLDSEELLTTDHRVQIPDARTLSSFSSLVRQYPATSVWKPFQPSLSLEEAPPHILNLPLGSKTGHILHGFIEALLGNALSTELLASQLKALQCSSAAWINYLEYFLEKLLYLPLPPSQGCLADSQAHRLIELEFLLPKPKSGSIPKQVLPSSTHTVIPEGYLHGFIDLVCQIHHKIFIFDWKSNFLGTQIQSYTPQNLETAMQHHHYHLQALLYCVATYRHCRLYQKDFDYQNDFGGIFYIFLRGLDFKEEMQAPENTPGIYFFKPAEHCIKALDDFLQDSP